MVRNADARSIKSALDALLRIHGIAPMNPEAGNEREGTRVDDLVGRFLESHARTVAASRLHGSKIYLNDFARSLGHFTIADMRVGGCDKIEAWVASHSGWIGCRASVVSRVKQMFKWGSDQGLYSGSPISGLKRPRDNSRVAYFTADQVEAILRHGSSHFRTAFTGMLATGCRPSELTYLDAGDVKTDPFGELHWTVHHKNERHTGQRRRVYLTPEAKAITEDLLKRFPTGRLFRSAANGAVDSPISETYINHALRKICQWPDCRELGLDEHKSNTRSNGTPVRLFKYVAYTCRHTFAVRYLTGHFRDAAGQPIILGYPEVAQYLGNSAAMVEKIYGHLVEQTRFLSARLRGAALPPPR